MFLHKTEEKAGIQFHDFHGLSGAVGSHFHEIHQKGASPLQYGGIEFLLPAEVIGNGGAVHPCFLTDIPDGHVGIALQRKEADGCIFNLLLLVRRFLLFFLREKGMIQLFLGAEIIGNG